MSRLLRSAGLLLIAILAFTAAQSSPIDTSKKRLSAFDQISLELQAYKPDTSAPPDDRITRTIRQIMALRGGFNINEALEYKIEEDRHRGEIPEVDLNQLALYLQKGEGRRQLDNAIIWIYRSTFNLKELQQIKYFYATSAGQKMADSFPLLMLKSLAAAQLLKDGFMRDK
jgi:hypothetical protein